MMTNEASSSPEEAPEENVTEAVHQAIEKVLNDHDGELGATILGDWIVIAECHVGQGRVLRIIDSDLPLWRRLGLVRFVDQDTLSDLQLLTLHSQSEDEEE